MKRNQRRAVPIALVSTGLLVGAPGAGATDCPYDEYFHDQAEQVVCDCRIEIDPSALEKGVLVVEFHGGEPRAGSKQMGCFQQALGGGVMVVTRGPETVVAGHTGPISNLGGAHFSNSLVVSHALLGPTTRYEVQVRHGAWTSNRVSFEYP